MENTIIPASSEHYLQMQNLWEALVRATHHFLTAEDISGIRAQLPGIFAQLMSYVIISDGALAGILGLTDDQIAMLFVHPDAFGKGIGKQLISYATIEHGLRKVEVNEQNPQAIGFYPHLGFKITGRREIDE
ncbi:GNAT family N-acetyltransferase [Mucilaginibacter myungsuensis]|uniref:GNAT family N-acetyltransferase n=1 Tax=Mucilaginibacter myungsuensis TaxID=649104 RepID=A0A929KYL1_9SPHI|nr:GNAT family N-acetyltransferase [Mucilaginibacter myungsuensis]MBE9660990.1 GNAT family N-acetyltransferase [Mucilaginibacter myungsuensis]MDN3601036.1 GNAT family N-acetyltransferase [Mucilaginibacter myungsuensis]